VASPVDAARVATNISTAADPWSITLPASSAGELLVALLRTGAADATGAITGWTNLVNDATDAGAGNVYVMYKWTVGGEGTSASVEWSAARKGGAIVWRITAAENPATQAPEQVGANYTTTANTANPPSVSPTGGSKDYLFLALGAQDGEVGAFTASPTNYSTITAANSGTGGTPGTNVQIGGGSRQLTAASEDPGAFTHAAAATGGRAIVVAIHPPGVVTNIETGSVVAGTVLAGIYVHEVPVKPQVLVTARR
jgi:hypothetical protein